MNVPDWLFLVLAGVIPPLAASLAGGAYLPTRRVARRLGWPVLLADSAHLGILVAAYGIALGSWVATPQTPLSRALVVLGGGLIACFAGWLALAGARTARRAVALEGQCPMVP